MQLKTQILQELKNPDFPDLKFLYSSEVLEIAPQILEELLEQEKKDFYKKLETPDNELSFKTFDDFSLLWYFFWILEHYQGVHSDDIIRKIIEDFEPKYIDFWNEVAYCKRYYEMLCIVRKQQNLNLEEIKILDQSIESYEIRWIALDEENQNILKDINKQLSDLSQKFSNNALDSQKAFEYIITNQSIISEMPEDDRAVARKKAEDKKVEWFLFDASQSSYGSIMKYCSDSSVRRNFYEARNMFATQGEYDNNPIILEILKLRDHKAKLLWFENYAELSLHF